MKTQLTERQIKILSKLADSIEEIKSSEDTIIIKFDKNVVLKNKNFVTLTDGFNINYATQIHLNPDYPKEFLEEGIEKRFNDVKIGIVKHSLKKLGYEIPENEIIDIVNGHKKLDIDIDCVKVKEIEQQGCSDCMKRG